VAEPDAHTAEPLVSVGLPTYNRAEKLMRAAESVLGQTHRNVELVISDNASTDDTQSLCRELCRRDPRARYLRSAANRGPTANFNTLFGELRGEYAMVLSDDDWLDHNYLANCLSELRRSPELALACGIAHYVRDGAVVREGVEMQLADDSPARRVLTYLSHVDENGVFYGLMRRSVLQRAAPLRNVLGNDWLLAAAIATQGKVATIRSTSINRELDGTSADFHKLTATLGLPGWQARVPHLVIAWHMLADVAWRAPVYRELRSITRVRLALAAPFAAIRWRSLAWHMTMPTFAALGRRRGGRWLWRLYARITRLAGAVDPSVRSRD
jgi:glycosyltransferase involved in cell wall biosynthesis